MFRRMKSCLAGKKLVLVFGLLFILPIRIFSQQNFWQPTNGPYANPNYFTSLTFGMDGKIYAGIGLMGLYCSSDTGNTFAFLSDHLKFINAVVIDNNNNIFMGGGDYVTSNGIFKSSNGGIDWTQSLPSRVISTLVLDSAGFIFAGTTDAGIYRSSDNGNTWIQNNIDSTIREVTALASSPNGDIFASGFTQDWPHRIRSLRSNNNGITWDSLSVPSDLFIKGFSFFSDNRIVAIFEDNDPGDSTGFLTSNDNGNTWSRHNVVKNYYGMFSVIYDTPSNSFFAAFPDENYSWVNLIRSTDNGVTWSNVSNLPAFGDYFYLTSNQKGFLFAGNHYGFKRSSDLGQSWNTIGTGFFATQCNQLTLLPGGRIYTGSANGVFKLADDRMNWLKDSSYAGSFLISSSGNYFLSAYAVIHKSSDYGNNWTTVFDPRIVGWGTFAQTSELTKLSNGYILSGGITGSGVHGAGGSIIWRSTDDGITWNSVYYHNPENFIYTIASAPNDIVFAGGGDNGVIRSTDYGSSWISCMTGLPAGINCRVVRIKEDGTIFLGSGSNGMFRSTDNGLSWNSINYGLNSLDIRSIAINSEGEIFIGTSDGVYISIDNGNQWTNLISGLRDVSVSSILCDSLGFIYIATNSTGVYRSFESTTSVLTENNLPSTFILSQNYPNPFNPSTKISWQTPVVYDVLGNEVATLVNEYRPAGSYEVEFKSTVGSHQLANGVYFYRLQAGDFFETKKMILLK